MAGAKRSFKTKKTLSGGPTSFRKWNEWKPEDYIVGIFQSRREDNYEKESYTFKVLEASFAGKPKTSRELVDKNITLNHTGQLGKAMEGAEEGKIYRITYNGKSKIESGKYAGKDSHLVSVEEVVEEGDEGSSADGEKDSGDL